MTHAFNWIDQVVAVTDAGAGATQWQSQRDAEAGASTEEDELAASDAMFKF
jgi:hypothetical protein